MYTIIGGYYPTDRMVWTGMGWSSDLDDAIEVDADTARDMSDRLRAAGDYVTIEFA